MTYEHLDRPDLGGRIHFRYAEPGDVADRYLRPAKLAEQGIAFAYLDAAKVSEAEALNSLGQQLRTDHLPYDPNATAGMKAWYRFMDDLETLSQREAGMAIIVDMAARLFAEPRSWAFQLIEVWVLQLPGWQQRKRPCHLIFQMDPNPHVEAIYGRGC
jgi:hypothetical protein